MNEAVAFVLDHLSEFIISLIGAVFTFLLPNLWKSIKNLFNLIHYKRLAIDLHPFYSRSDIKKHIQYFVHTRFEQHSIVSDSKINKSNTAKKLISYFLHKILNSENDSQRYFIILADSGMGKTTFLINLYFKYVRMWNKKLYSMRLLPLGYPNIDEEIINIKDKENTILLLDAFDEYVTGDLDYKAKLTTLMNKIWRFRIVILTCRTQFFPTQSEEPDYTDIKKFIDGGDYYAFTKIYILPFLNSDVRAYLNKRFSILALLTKRRAWQAVKRFPNLLVRPMLLSHIDELIKNKISFRFSFEIYKYLISKWIERESMLIKPNKREDFKEQLFNFSKAMAIDMYQNRHHRHGLFVERKDFNSFAISNNIELNELQMSTRSLLTRNATGHYFFTHKSFLEYFLATETFNNEAFEKEFNFDGFDVAELLYKELNFVHYTLPFFKINNELLQFCWVQRATDKEMIQEVPQMDWYQIRDLVGFTYSHRKPLDLRVVIGLRNLSVLWYFSSFNKLKFDLSLLRIATQLKVLALHLDNLEDLSFLTSLTELTDLDLSNNNIVDIKPLAGLLKLETLSLYNNKIKDIEPLEKLLKLKRLNLSGNKINNIHILAKLKNIHFLYLNYTGLSNVSYLEYLTDLFILELSNNRIKDISFLINLIKLNELNLSHNQIVDISPLSYLKENFLSILSLSHNQIDDITPLTDLNILSKLAIKANPININQINFLSKTIKPTCKFWHSLSLDGVLGVNISNLPDHNCRFVYTKKIESLLYYVYSLKNGFSFDNYQFFRIVMIHKIDSEKKKFILSTNRDLPEYYEVVHLINQLLLVLGKDDHGYGRLNDSDSDSIYGKNWKGRQWAKHENQVKLYMNDKRFIELSFIY